MNEAQVIIIPICWLFTWLMIRFLIISCSCRTGSSSFQCISFLIWPNVIWTSVHCASNPKLKCTYTLRETCTLAELSYNKAFLCFCIYLFSQSLLAAFPLFYFSLCVVVFVYFVVLLVSVQYYETTCRWFSSEVVNLLFWAVVLVLVMRYHQRSQRKWYHLDRIVGLLVLDVNI